MLKTFSMMASPIFRTISQCRFMLEINAIRPSSSLYWQNHVYRDHVPNIILDQVLYYCINL